MNGGDETCGVSESLSRARHGDAAAFAVLVRKYQRMVFSLALRMLCDRGRAEDLAQDVFLQLHRKLATVESAAHLTYWLRRVTTNLAIDRLRQEPRYEASPLDEEPGVEYEASEADPLLERQLRGYVGELSPTARAVVLLRFEEDLDPSDIAETLDMSLNTVKSHLRRSLDVLRERFGSRGREGASDAQEEVPSP